MLKVGNDKVPKRCSVFVKMLIRSISSSSHYFRCDTTAYLFQYLPIFSPIHSRGLWGNMRFILFLTICLFSALLLVPVSSYSGPPEASVSFYIPSRSSVSSFLETLRWSARNLFTSSFRPSQPLYNYYTPVHTVSHPPTTFQNSYDDYYTEYNSPETFLPAYEDYYESPPSFPSSYYKDSHHRTVFTHHTQPSQGWTKPQKNKTRPCKAIYDMDITKPEDIERYKLRILKVIGKADDETGRVEVNAKTLLTPPLQLIPQTIRPIITADGPPFNISSVRQIQADSSGNRISDKVITPQDSEFSSSLAALDSSVDSLKATITIYQVPRLTTPLRGNFDRKHNFLKGLNWAEGNRSAGLTISPIENFFEEDANFVADLFGRLREFKRTEGESETVESLVEMPSLVALVQKHFVTEPDHSERTVLDAEFNFGLPVVNFRFGNSSALMESWKEVRRLERRKVEAARDAARRFGNLQRFREYVGSFLRERLTLQGKVGAEAYLNVEKQLQESYTISQFLVCQTSTGPCGECPLDPILMGAMFAHFKNSGSSGGGRIRGTPLSFPPRG